MAAYAALVSLSHILHHILHPPPTHHFIIPRRHIESLQEKVRFFIYFLETYSSRLGKEIEDLEKRITDAAYAAEDIIESEVVGQIRANDSIRTEKKKSFALFYQSIQKGIKKFLPSQHIPKVIKEFVSIQKELVEIKNRKHIEDVRSGRSIGASSSRSVPSGKNIMVGFDKHLTEVRSTLATDASNRQIVPIVGMGGIGKTTLAANVYKDAYIVEYFEIRAWVSVSKEYTVREIVLALLHEIDSIDPKEEGRSADELGNLLHKELFGRRYLIVLDDMWDIQAWHKLKMFLPDNNNGSRVLATTRLLKVAKDFGSCDPYQIGLLDEEKSWDLILEKVFAKQECPDELEGIGRSIARKCGGLPLVLVVISGLLAKSEKTREFWEYVEEDVTFAANSEGDEHCMKILSLSYSYLSVHLRPCFLYLAMFPKNFEIRVSRLIRLWVAEGFIKPVLGRSLEEDAKKYLEDLFDRNLIMVGERGRTGKVKTIGVHDLIRDLCRTEAHKNKFLCIAKLDDPQTTPHMEKERRLSIHVGTRKEEVCKVLRSVTLNRSFLSYSYWESRRCVAHGRNFLRVLDVVDYYPMDEILQLINSRYITCAISRELHLVSSVITQLWNLQTLVVPGLVSLPPEIWEMPQLRHLRMTRITLPDPPQVDGPNIMVLENLQTLSTVKDFIFREQVLRKIPNLKKLGIYCRATEEIGSFCLSNLVSLHRLESLALAFDGNWKDIAFPDALKKLTLSYCQIPWEDMSMVGSLPNLEVLKLHSYAAKGRNWNPNEGEFCRLMFLLIDSCQLEIWGAEARHFPILEQLHLKNLELKEIPMDFVEIPTLQMINLNYCSSLLFTSAKRMSKERELLGYEDIQVRSFPSETRIRIQDNVVGFEDEADTIIRYLIEESEQLEVISIIGMPGLGKTTLAWKIYHDVRIQYEFPTLIWVSQDFDIREVCLTILKRFTLQDMSSLSDPELAQRVRSYLERPKFLLFMDDVWTAEAWKLIETALPKSNKLGKVLITSQYEKVAWGANPRRDPHKLRFLNSDESWELLQLEVFGNLDECREDLEMLGKQIAEQCGGVPLAILVIGAILAKQISTSSDVKDEWENISSSLSKYVSDDKQKCTENIIQLSCNKLPHDLRNCFLYIGMFPDQTEIPAWKLIRLWIAEGFIKQKQDHSLEEVAEDNLKDLINRNLVMVDKTKANGDVKTCRVHGMIREFCKGQVAFAKENLFLEVKKSMEGTFDPPVSDIRKYNRLCIHSHVLDFLGKKPKGPGVHSFLCFSKEAIVLPPEYAQSIPEAFNLLSVLDVNPIKFTEFPTKLAQLIHLRYIALSGDNFRALPKAVSELWDLQTIRIDTMSPTFEIKANIWKMMQLRHLKTKAAIILNTEAKGEAGENLQTLSRLSAQCCTEDVFNRASNLKILGICGQLATLFKAKCLEKLDRLQKLELVHDVFLPSENPPLRLPKPERFPPNIRILKLSSTYLDWSHMATLGKIHTLEVLKLKEYAFAGRVWRAVAGGFPSLEFLHIERTYLEFWTATADPFPKLKCLVLKHCLSLEEIPSVVGNSLQILDIERVTKSLVASARRLEREKQQMQSQERAKRGGFKLIIAPGDGCT